VNIANLWTVQDGQRIPCAAQAEQKNEPKSSEELVEVHCRGRQDHIDRIALNALQSIAFQPVLTLRMSDAGLDRGVLGANSEWGGEPTTTGGQSDPGLELMKANTKNF